MYVVSKYVLVGVAVLVGVVVLVAVVVELVGVVHSVLGITVGFTGAGASRNLVVGRVSPGRNVENTDLGISVVLNNSVST